MAEGENLRLQLESGPKGRPDSSEEGNEQRTHVEADRISSAV